MRDNHEPSFQTEKATMSGERHRCHEAIKLYVLSMETYTSIVYENEILGSLPETTTGFLNLKAEQDFFF